MSVKKGKTEEIKKMMEILEKLEEKDVYKAIQEVKLRKGQSDPFSLLGKGAPILRAVFNGIEYPIKDRQDLIRKAGGEDRLVIIPDPDGGERIYALLDLLEAFPELDRLFPIESPYSFVKKFAAIERRRRREGKPSPLLMIGGNHIKQLIHKRSFNKRRLREYYYVKRLEIPSIRYLEKAETTLGLLRAFKNDEGLKILDEKGVSEWIQWLINWLINYHRRSALASAAAAQEQANRAERAANEASSRVRDVAGSSTNIEGQEISDEVCAKAREAADAAERANSFAANACSHAGAIPDDVEAQTACSDAQSYASQANSAAAQAFHECELARDIASISIVRLCGHVTEEDPCCDDDVDNAYIEVCNEDYPSIPCQSTTTDSGGNYCVTGRFGHSSRIGCAHVLVSMTAYGVNITKRVTICNSSPHNVNFSFDAPGTE